MNGHILVLGGARSGKTALAERIATRNSTAPAYLATAEALDDEMMERVSAHQRSREGRFATIEEPLELPQAIFAAAQAHDVILIDCLTLWITNLLSMERDVADEVDTLVEVLEGITNTQIIIVSNEVGLGIVPDNALARTFRDLAGAAHQELAGICQNVYFVVAGLPLVVKGEAPEL
ncbi:bifunctional adenosylcobinamide kinase/adenosylcobinamide-phosphate guanylyltransferase [Pelagibacterium sp. 26DY04]|uniref:bifunctional adenosylcobinamide kinase/adenosylcobinamide-phosphate guanylyltransferase n=1 Tax=unclassified Pelagibacterium TaxID=2623280 RepID=UPI0028160B5A|nr:MULTISPECIES: bifunctional adenosylcobinamide kinase/adenosylcobinamide-phosphate guanylyltransferase [unclassified Pelagibacterium]WMT87380.1 bifunctional adenosylcobinamide kinase/adenosylcobinamide-phosphate guanylyltransferase [Pelagibacterium sp. 26DY04]WMT91816.1 bifunctional adenosylcobinamide kinase/adenosylcobinamide-phosphate guanylyltransferase [Pelagibacterium sp. H642]